MAASCVRYRERGRHTRLPAEGCSREQQCPHLVSKLRAGQKHFPEVVPAVTDPQPPMEVNACCTFVRSTAAGDN
ncbi:hypothetical protein U0070_006209 [Myodes glareolus]|uniref:Uncharacterized protein n=1 Tax=Myodes glareolus TaxID=447135 RepID=A0AAW0HIA5_MYOGA